MFWGLMLEPGKRYSQTVDDSFHISMACLEPSHPSKVSELTRVMIQHDKAELLLCCLASGSTFQQPLDLNFTEGEEITLYVEGTGNVHLTGYLVSDQGFDQEEALEGELEYEESEEEEADMEEDEDDDDEDEEEEDEDVPSLQALVRGEVDLSSDEEREEEWQPKAAKRKRALADDVPETTKQTKKSKKEKLKESKKKRKESSDEEDNIHKSADYGEDNSDDDDDDGDDDDDDDNERLDKEIGSPKRKKHQSDTLINSTPKNQTKGKESSVPQSNGDELTNQNSKVDASGDAKKKKKKKKKKGSEADSSNQTTESSSTADQASDQTQEVSKKKKLPLGVVVQDIKEGEGQIAKPGKMMILAEAASVIDSPRYQPTLELQREILYFAGKAVSVQLLRALGPRRLRQTTDEEFTATVNSLLDYGYPIKLRAPRSKYSTTLFLKKYPDDITDWSEMIDKDLYISQYHKATSGKITPQMRLICIQAKQLPDDYFD